MINKPRVICNEEGRCFAKVDRNRYSKPTCSLLYENYPEGKCPFKKPIRDETNGIFYPCKSDY